MGKRRKKHLCPPRIFGFFPFSVQGFKARMFRRILSMNRPTPDPSKEGKRPTRAEPQFPSWEGSGVGSAADRGCAFRVKTPGMSATCLRKVILDYDNSCGQSVQAQVNFFEKSFLVLRSFQWNHESKSSRCFSLPMNFTPKAALKTPALQTLPLAPWDKRRGVWAARRAGYPTGRVPDGLLRREAFGVRASLAPLLSRCSPKVWFRGLRREPLREILSPHPMGREFPETRLRALNL